MIYLDNAATTPVDKEVLEAVMPFFKENFGNPQSQHCAGRAAANAVISARDEIAGIIGCKPEEVYFVSGGTEAGNTAVKGVCAAHGKGHMIVSSIEHPAVLESAKQMTKFGFEVTFVKPDVNGIIHAEAIEKAVKKDTFFCAVMAANNEVGTVQPVKDIGKICKDNGIFYYCDCVQSAGVLPFPTDYCDALALSAHKFYGPKGIGALYIKNGSRVEGLISGGMQERGLRGGTLNAAAVIGLAEALKRAARDSERNNAYIGGLRDYFLNKVLTEIEGTRLNGDKERRVPSNANISFEGCEGQNILFLLDLNGIAVSTGSACSAGAVTPSHVLTAMGFTEERVKSAVRFTFGKYNTFEEADVTVEALKRCVAKIRNK